MKENKSFEKPCQTDFLLYWRQLKDKNSRKLKFPEATLPQNKFYKIDTNRKTPQRFDLAKAAEYEKTIIKIGKLK